MARILFLLLATLLHGMDLQAAPTIVRGEIGSRLDGAVTNGVESGFSGSILVAKSGTILLQKGYGLANRESGELNLPETLFETGSFAKQITAAALFVLSQDGKLSLDDPLSKFLPDVPDSYGKATVLQVLSHAAGIPRGGSGRGLDIAAAVREHLKDPPLFAPGEKQSYSNSGYALLAGVIEQVSGDRYEDFCRERLFVPAGMTTAGFCGEHHTHAADSHHCRS